MELIPVIDLLGGIAVHAVAGERDRYRPINSMLSPTAEPEAVVNAYLTVSDFKRFYIADLDAIEGRGDNRSIVRTLCSQFQGIEWWLDGGFYRQAQFDWLPPQRVRPVLGSESQPSTDSFSALLNNLASPRPVLSLDFKNQQFLGPPQLLDEPERWPTDVIVMQLDRVGIGSGPATLRPHAGIDHHYYAAGGVRDIADVKRLEKIGFSGVLVASALHDGRIGTADLA